MASTQSVQIYVPELVAEGIIPSVMSAGRPQNEHTGVDFFAISFT